MTNKKTKLWAATIICISFLLYTAFHNNDEWQVNDKKRGEPTHNYFDDPDIRKMIEKGLENVDYAAIVYGTASHVYPNSWFHKKIMGEPFDSTYHLVKADVEYTIIGKQYDTITYSSSSRGTSSSPVLVLLCGSNNNQMYAPDNGYEFAASKELIEYFKNIGKQIVKKKTPDVCP